MAISFVGSATNSGIDGSNVTLTLPGGMQQNDLVVLAYVIGADLNNDHDMQMVTAGYTEVSDLFANDGRACNLGVFYKFMGATPDSSAQVNGGAAVREAVAVGCLVFRGVDTVTPLDVAATTATGIDTMHPNPPAIDWVTAGTWVVIAVGSATFNAVQTYTFPSGYTTNAISASGDDNVDAHVGMGYRSAPSDPEDPGVVTLSGTDAAEFSWCAATLALRQAVAGTPYLAFPRWGSVRR